MRSTFAERESASIVRYEWLSRRTFPYPSNRPIPHPLGRNGTALSTRRHLCMINIIHHVLCHCTHRLPNNPIDVSTPPTIFILLYFFRLLFTSTFNPPPPFYIFFPLIFSLSDVEFLGTSSGTFRDVKRIFVFTLKSLFCYLHLRY